MLAAILLITKYRAADPMRACEAVNTLVLTAGKARLAVALVALAAQAVLFYSRSTAAPSGWRRYVSVLLVMAALAAAIAGEFSLSLTMLLSNFGAGADAATRAHLQLSQGGMALLVLELILVAAALATGVKQRERATPEQRPF